MCVCEINFFTCHYSRAYHAQPVLVVAQLQQVLNHWLEDVLDLVLWKLHDHLLKHVGCLRLDRVLQHLPVDPRLNQREFLLHPKQLDQTLHRMRPTPVRRYFEEAPDHLTLNIAYVL